MLTTDFFEFGNSANGLEAEGCAVEMGDAVLGLLCDGMPKRPALGDRPQPLGPADQRRSADASRAS